MREKLYSDLLTDEHIIIKDSTTVDWRTFRWDNGYFVHHITVNEILVCAKFEINKTSIRLLII